MEEADMMEFKATIGGRPAPVGADFAVLNPATGQEVGRAPNMGGAELDAAVSVANADNEVSALSIMGLMMLAASPGTQVVLRATGRQAEEVLTALEELICSRFGEGE